MRIITTLLFSSALLVGCGDDDGDGGTDASTEASTEAGMCELPQPILIPGQGTCHPGLEGCLGGCEDPMCREECLMEFDAEQDCFDCIFLAQERCARERLCKDEFAPVWCCAQGAGCEGEFQCWIENCEDEFDTYAFCIDNALCTQEQSVCFGELIFEDASVGDASVDASADAAADASADAG